ncbi:TIGR03621 family F420-dependent LLM class oxidoreductase [Nonomuraea phyllanthi]|uniref:TIGR03621 family F420-dependent LLM class oxidoreductase n=1 Tax=Nonomuraea phyllanthi TaxID=2219224 RepID=A0A5C4WJP5_9ACTN|nr:TIGR03621 family F420-dependent LLM class oxidoreductase [Nonomuraea phyllanthi]KAB8194032.1 TIGR03621 family F420-dependent LLM class oxidoreductase [Nonomuraea phyllanthi]QFY07633.1 TIGR03621 family F420-dependent LLM class oxidoreductase [Nonomuraea phyllanthi]
MFRFGVVLHEPATRRAWVEKCRRAESLGYDTIAVADHLGMPAPFPSLLLAAEATERVRLSTHMLNAGFYRPALAYRDVASTDLLTEGRLELGIGAGHAQAEFEAAGLPYGSGGERVDALERMVAELRRMFADPAALPRPAQPSGPPIMIAGRGNRLLRFAAREADIIGFNGAAAGAHTGGLPAFASRAEMAERVDYARAALGERAGAVEFNSTVPAVVITNDRRGALERLAHHAPQLSVEERGEVPSLLVGTREQIADQLRANRDRLGFSYITVMENSLEPMGQVIELFR